MPTLYSDDVPHLPGYTRPPNPAAQLHGQQQARISVLAREAEFKQWGRPAAAQAPHRAAAGAVLAGRQRSPPGNKGARLGNNTIGGHAMVLNGVPSAWEVPPPPQPPSTLQRPASSKMQPQSARGRLEEHGVHSSSHMYRSRPQHQQPDQTQQAFASTTYGADLNQFSATLNAMGAGVGTGEGTGVAPAATTSAIVPWEEWDGNAEAEAAAAMRRTEADSGNEMLSPAQVSSQGVRGSVKGTRIETTSQAFDADAVVNNANANRGAGAPGIRAAGGRPRTAYGGPGAGGLAPQWHLSSNDALRFRCYYEEPNVEYVLPARAHEAPTRGAEAVPRTVVRPVMVLFFLQDASLAIHDWRVPNSGVDSSLGGRFMRRTTLYKQQADPAQGGEPVLFDAGDFAVGSTIVVNARRFTVVDADTRTREWFLAHRGVALAPALPIPDDGLAADRLRIGGVGGANSGGGGSSGAVNACPSDLIAPLLRDTTVLRFHAVGLLAPLISSSSSSFSCSSSSSEAEVAYTLLYFTQNDTIAVKARGNVDGLGHQFPLLLKRGRLPKDSVEVPGNDHFTSLNGYEGAIVTWQDLKCGEVLKVYGRSLLLISADVQTTEWYAARGVFQTPLEVVPDHHHPPQQNTGVLAGQPTMNQGVNRGIGAGSVSGLVGSNHGARGGSSSGHYNSSSSSGGADNMSKYALGISLKPVDGPPKAPPASAAVATNANGGCSGGDSEVVLRFSAQMKDAPISNNAALSAGSRLNYGYLVPSPAPRKFVLAFHCADQTLSVYEPQVPNSGYQGGPFLARMRYKKHVPLPHGATRSMHLPPPSKQQQQQQRGSVLSRWFRASDFYLGADFTVELPSSGTLLQRFVLQDCDVTTQRWLETHGGGTYKSGDFFVNGTANGNIANSSYGWGDTENYERGAAAGANGSAHLARLLERLAELLLAHKVNPRAVLASITERLLGSTFASSLPSSSSPILASFRAGLVPEAVFVEFLRDHLGLALPSMLSSPDVDMLVWEFAVPASVTVADVTAGARAGGETGAEAMAADLGLFVDAATFVDGLALHHQDPEILMLQKAWAVAAHSKPRGGAPLLSSTSPFGSRSSGSTNGNNSRRSPDPVETRLLQRLQLHAGVVGGSSNHPSNSSSSSGGNSKGEAWRIRQSFREVDRQYHHGVVPLEVWFDVLKRHRFQDLLTRAQAESFARKFPAPPPLSSPSSHGFGTGNNRAITSNNKCTWVNYHALCDAVFPTNFAAVLESALAVDALMNKVPDAESVGSARSAENLHQSQAASATNHTAMMRHPAASHAAWSGSNPQVQFSPRQPSPPPQSVVRGNGNGSRYDDGRMCSTGATTAGGAAAAPPSVPASPTTTVSDALRKLTAGDEQSNKDVDHQLLEAMRSFASTFARPTRKAAFRKHCLALDTKLTGRLSRKWLQAAVETTVREENLNSYRPELLLVLLDFVYPDSRCEIPFEDFLELVLGRDVQRAHEVRQRNLQEQGSSNSFNGDAHNGATAAWGW